jgi:hypothetical protein
MEYNKSIIHRDESKMALGLSFNPVWQMQDLNGLQLDDTYYFFTLQNSLPYLPQPLWQDPEGNVNWSVPIQFLANGQLPINMYWDDTITYRLEIRKGPDQSFPLIYLIENYTPSGEGQGPTPGTIAVSSDNELTNPQFASVLFTNPLTSSASTIDLGQGWQLLLTSGVSVTVNQVAFSGTADIPTNPPYALQVISGGTGTVTLQQVFHGNGALWANGSVSMNFTAACTAGISNVTGQILYSTSVNPPVIVIEDLLTNVYSTFSEAIVIEASTNTDVPPAAYTAVQIIWNSNTEVVITSVQLIGQHANDAFPQDYIEEPIERQTDYAFHYYQPQLNFKPIPSYLTGWDFPINPSQFGTSGTIGSIGANKGAYVWDQTIVYQTTDNSVNFTENSNGDLVLNMIATGQVALIQYLTTAEMFRIMSTNLSVNVISCSPNQSASATVSLWYTTLTTVPSISSGNNTLVNSLDAHGHPDSIAAGWHEITRGPLGNATFTMPSSIQNPMSASVGLSGWQALPTSTAVTAKYFAIVIGTSSVASGNAVEFSSISLVPGDIPTIPAPETYIQSVTKCQYYFEKSYDLGDAIGTATLNGCLYAPQVTTTTGVPSMYPAIFDIQFKQPALYTNPVIVTYSVLGAQYNVYGNVIVAGSSFVAGNVSIGNWTQNGLSNNGVLFIPNTATPISIASSNIWQNGCIFYHYVKDSRIGII